MPVHAHDAHGDFASSAILPAAPETDLRRPTTGLGGALSLFCESPLRITPERGLELLLMLLKADI